MTWRGASVLSVFAAMLSKENAITAPFIAVSIDFLLFGTPLRRAIWNARGLLLLVPYLPLVLWMVSIAQSGGTDALRTLNIAHSHPDPAYQLHYLMSQLEVWWKYLALFVWPSALNIDPDMPPITDCMDPRFLSASAGWIVLGGAFCVLWRSPRHRGLVTPIALGFVWFAFTVLPDSSLVPLPDLMAEHRTYLPSVGLCIGAVTALLSCRAPVLWIFSLSAVGLVCLGMASVNRSRAWSSPVALWEDTTRKSPGKVRCWLNLGAARYEAGHLELAEEAFLKSLQIRPTVPGVANLATVYLRLGRADQALAIARDGLSLRPTGYDHVLLTALAEALVRTGRPEEAVRHYEELLLMNPAMLLANHNLGHCLLLIGRFYEAKGVFLEALRHHPNHPGLLSGLAAAEAGSAPLKLRLAP